MSYATLRHILASMAARHQRAADELRAAGRRCVRPEIRDYAWWLAQRENETARRLYQYLSEAPGGVPDVWFQFAELPTFGRLDQCDPEELEATVVELDQAILQLYQRLAREALNDDVTAALEYVARLRSAEARRASFAALEVPYGGGEEAEGRPAHAES